MCCWPVQCHRQTFSALCQGGYRSSPPPPSTKWRLARSSDASLPPNASTPPSSAESFAGNTKQKKTSVEPICQPQLLLLFFCVFTQWRSSSKDDGRCFSLSAESRALPSIYNTHERERASSVFNFLSRGWHSENSSLCVLADWNFWFPLTHMLLQSHHHHFRRKKNFLFPPNMELIFKEWVWHKSFGNQSAGTSFGGR